MIHFLRRAIKALLSAVCTINFHSGESHFNLSAIFRRDFPHAKSCHSRNIYDNTINSSIDDWTKMSNLWDSISDINCDVDISQTTMERLRKTKRRLTLSPDSECDTNSGRLYYTTLPRCIWAPVIMNGTFGLWKYDEEISAVAAA